MSPHNINKCSLIIYFMVIILFILALIWVVFAIVQDFKQREIANWVSFSLIIFALAIRLFYSIFSGDYNYILFGIAGLAVFFVLANAFYYMRLFAGGDAKLLIALGAVIPIESIWYSNLLIGFVFIIALFLTGALYSLIYSGVIAYKNKTNFSRDFKKQFRENKNYFFVSLGFAIIFLVIGFISGLFALAFFSLMIFVLPYLYIYTKAVESACMIKEISVKELTIGDWLVKSIKVKTKTIKPDWEGLSEGDLIFIQKNYRKKVLVKYGVPFSPAFLFALLTVMIIKYFFNSNWRFI